MDFTVKQCGCKGIRTCLVCEGRKQPLSSDNVPAHTLHQCHNCGRIGEMTKIDNDRVPLHVCQSEPCGYEPVLRAKWHECRAGADCGDELMFDGVVVVKDFVTAEEEKVIVSEIDSRRWAESQSGRRKQDYGPKVNFKRQKIKLGSFSGLPSFSQSLLHHMHTTLRELEDFTPVELCNLDYEPHRGSSIDPHVDDSWLWGERLVTLNLLSHTILTFSTPHTHTHTCLGATHMCISLPRRSLVIVQGPARHSWLHSIQRRHITARRLAITLRELSKEFQDGGVQFEPLGREILEIAGKFDGLPTNFS